MGLILPDTNILILALANQEHYGDLLTTWITQKKLALSPVVVAEFLIKATPKETKSFNQLTNRFPVIPIDLETAQVAAKIRKTSLAQKKKLILPDCLIAAQCQIHKLTLATLNPKDFPKKLKLFPL
jgi:predicted nucleic acid-binding protein